MTKPARVPDRAGVGFKPQHLAKILEKAPRVGWFEVHAENYMGAGGAPHRQLESLREIYPIAVHGVGLSIGGAAPLDQAHLTRLKRLVERYEPGLVSEHLAWSNHRGVFLSDLLPIPYTEETLARVVAHVDALQSALGRRILLENPAVYVGFAESAIGETDFLRAVAARTGCGLLLDVNNVHVSTNNLGTAAAAYLDAFPLDRVEEIHLAGHAPDRDDEGKRLLIDSHDRAVDDAVWALYRRVLERAGPLPTLIEWDKQVPGWTTLADEAARAERILADACPSPRLAYAR